MTALFFHTVNVPVFGNSWEIWLIYTVVIVFSWLITLLRPKQVILTRTTLSLLERYAQSVTVRAALSPLRARYVRSVSVRAALSPLTCALPSVRWLTRCTQSVGTRCAQSDFHASNHH